MSDSITPTRICTKCKLPKPATNEYFHRNKNHHDGLSSRCKVCALEAAQEWVENNPEQYRKNQREYQQKYRERHPDKIKAYRLKHKPKKRIANRRRYLADKPRFQEYGRNYRQNNAEKLRIRYQRRQARKRGLPDTLTIEQWQLSVDYFNGCCAVCGRQLKDLFGTHTAAKDHWIPLSNPDCPGTVATNIVPLCHGQDGCNNSKNDANPTEWLIWKYGKRKAIEILDRVNVYFEWIAQHST